MAGSVLSALPTMLSTPSFRPRDSDLPMTNSRLGPGNRISASAATENAELLVAGRCLNAAQFELVSSFDFYCLIETVLS